MGRPIQKRQFGTLDGTKIKATVNIGNGAEIAFISKQSGTRKYRVVTPVDGPRTDVVKLVNKIDEELSIGEANIKVNIGEEEYLVNKLQQNRVTFWKNGLLDTASWKNGDAHIEMHEGIIIAPEEPEPENNYTLTYSIIGEPGSHAFAFEFKNNGEFTNGVIALTWDVQLDNGVDSPTGNSGSELLTLLSEPYTLFYVPDNFVDATKSGFLTWEFGGPTGTVTVV
jgi:hypothetical protein